LTARKSCKDELLLSSADWGAIAGNDELVVLLTLATGKSLTLKDFSTIGDTSSTARGTRFGRSSVGIVSLSSSSIITALFNTEQHDDSWDMYDREPNSGLAGVM
jgi:hypothetical protein